MIWYVWCMKFFIKVIHKIDGSMVLNSSINNFSFEFLTTYMCICAILTNEQQELNNQEDHKMFVYVLTVFLTGLDKHWMTRGIPSFWVTRAALAGSASTNAYWVNFLEKITGSLLWFKAEPRKKSSKSWNQHKFLQLWSLPEQALQIPPIPNSTSFSLGSVKQSRKSSITLSCWILQDMLRQPEEKKMIE